MNPMTDPDNPDPKLIDDVDDEIIDEVLAAELEHDTLKYSLLGPSLTKAGQDAVDQSKVSEIIYNASKGSKFFNREEVRDQTLTRKIQQILEKKRRLEKLDLTREQRAADQLVASLELSRDLTQNIVHVDCDAFYAAVEQLDRPELKELPFAVGAGVLTTCNYVARQSGCRSGMAGFVAKKLCPQLILLKPNFQKYTAKAREVREVLADYDPRFESASCDEAYLNITQYCIDHDMSPEDAVNQMRAEIHEKTRITVSAGIAANAKLAKIGSNMNKPNGQFRLPSDRTAIMSFMRDLPTRKVNGIGRVWERELREIGIEKCGDIYPNRHLLRQLFGEKAYEFLLTVYLGLGRTQIQPAEDYERKSVGTESTFKDMFDLTQLKDKLRWTADELEKDMKRAECKGRTLVLKVKLHTYETFTRQVVTPFAVCKADDLYNYSLPILTRLHQDMPEMKLRLMGLRCTQLVSTKKPDARAFFGLRPSRGESVDCDADTKGKRKASQALGINEEWEVWPEATVGEDDGPPTTKAEGDAEKADGDDEDYRHHGKEITSNPKRNLPPPGKADEEEEYWDCPICSRPQPALERQFNEHIDLCLSRQTIRETVQRDSPAPPPPPPAIPDAKRPRLGSSGGSGDKKRKGGRLSKSEDPKQMKLFFG